MHAPNLANAISSYNDKVLNAGNLREFTGNRYMYFVHEL